MMRQLTSTDITVMVALVVAVLLAGSAASGRSTTGDRPAAAPVDLSTVVAHWPLSWTVSGTHSEATYVEHIRITRRADDFELTIGITAQGAQAGGTWNRAVRVGPLGTIVDLNPDGCAGDCTGLDGLRGYLAAAVMLSLHRSGTGPAAGVVRGFGARSVICVPGDPLYAAARMPVSSAAVVLDPCFDSVTGAVVAQYAPALGTFGGPTLDTRTLAIST